MNVGEVFLESFKNFFDVILNIGVIDVVIIGDFNFFCVDWFIGLVIVVDNLMEFFCEILDDNFFI